jgi:hypothetical protein
MPELELILPYSIARYLVESIVIPFPENTAERAIGVAGEKLSFQKLIDALGEAQGKKYDCEYLDPAEAKRKGLEAKEKGDGRRDMMWSVKPLAASGFGVVVGGVDNERFSFRPETVREAFERVYGRPSFCAV